MVSTISQEKQRKPRRDKLPSSEKHAHHLEASRSYYARYTLSIVTIYEMLIMLLTRNKIRIQEEQRLRTRK